MQFIDGYGIQFFAMVEMVYGLFSVHATKIVQPLNRKDEHKVHSGTLGRCKSSRQICMG